MRSTGELAVRNGDAVSDPGRAQPLALQERLEDVALRQAGDAGGVLGEGLQRLLLGVRLQGRPDHGRSLDQIA